MGFYRLCKRDYSCLRKTTRRELKNYLLDASYGMGLIVFEIFIFGTTSLWTRGKRFR